MTRVRTATSAPANTAWMEQAACAGMDTGLFFIYDQEGKGGGTRLQTEANAAQIRRARAVCWTCPVKAVCLEWAIENERHGVWGGLTEDERRRIRRNRTRRAPR